MAIFQNLKVPSEEESLAPNNSDESYDYTDEMDFTDGYPEEPDIEEPGYEEPNEPSEPEFSEEPDESNDEVVAEPSVNEEPDYNPYGPIPVAKEPPKEQPVQSAKPKEQPIQNTKPKELKIVPTAKENINETPKKEKRGFFFKRKKKTDANDDKKEENDEEKQQKIPSYDPVKEAEQIMTPEKTWVLVRQIGALSEEERKSVYGQTSIDSILSTHTAVQARQKYIEWENANRLNVGDQVIAQDHRGKTYYYWVTYIDETGYINGIEDNGRVRIAKVTDIQKTGRKKDIQKLLNQLVMQEIKHT